MNRHTVKPVMRGHLNKCPYMTGVPSSQVQFNVKLHFGSQKIQFRYIQTGVPSSQVLLYLVCVPLPFMFTLYVYPLRLPCT